MKQLEQVRLMAVEKKVDLVDQKLVDHIETQKNADKRNDEDHKELKANDGRIEAKIDGLPDKLQEQFAKKEVEEHVDKLDTRVWWIIGLFASGFVTVIIYLLESNFRK